MSQTIENMSAAELIQQQNAIAGELEHRRNGRCSINTPTLVSEVLDLLGGTGNFYPETNYAPDRVYSKIKGVKNIRLHPTDNVVYVKLNDKRFCDLPQKIVVNDVMYNIILTLSDNA